MAESDDPECFPMGRVPAEGPLLGIDWGKKRVGVACVRAFDIVHPICFIDAEPRGLLLAAIKSLAEDRDCVGLVVGLPVNMDGSEGPSAQSARQLGRELEAHSGLPVAFCDERLTSYSAQKSLGPMHLTRKQKKKRVDAIAAAAILETFLQQRTHDKRSGQQDGGAAHEKTEEIEEEE